MFACPRRRACFGSQSVKTSELAGKRGYDGAKKLTGRKHHLTVGTLGVVLAVAITADSVDDAEGPRQVLAEIDRECFPRLETMWADTKYRNYDLYE